MKNKKVIVLNGFGRGGTNIAWNIIQSHPAVCSAQYEVGELLAYLFPPRKGPIPLFLLPSLDSSFWFRPLIFRVATYLIDRRFYRYKLKTLHAMGNREKFESVSYSKTEVEQSVLVLKSISGDIVYNELFMRMYSHLYFVGIIRNGYALCEGRLRRGGDAADYGRTYHDVAQTMIDYSQKYKYYTIVKFEDMLLKPFETASEIYRFANLDPTEIGKLRLKAKKVLTSEGEHKTTFGSAGDKGWFDPDTITQVLVPNISQIQSDKLSESDRLAFEREAMPMLEYFGYR